MANSTRHWFTKDTRRYNHRAFSIQAYFENFYKRFYKECPSVRVAFVMHALFSLLGRDFLTKNSYCLLHCHCHYRGETFPKIICGRRSPRSRSRPSLRRGGGKRTCRTCEERGTWLRDARDWRCPPVAVPSRRCDAGIAERLPIAPPSCPSGMPGYTKDEMNEKIIFLAAKSPFKKIKGANFIFHFHRISTSRFFKTLSLLFPLPLWLLFLFSNNCVFTASASASTFITKRHFHSFRF